MLALVNSAFADEAYFNAFGGWGAHNQASMEDSNTRPTGTTFGIGLGKRYNFYEFELNISRGKYSTDIEHDGVSNKLINKQTQYSLALNFYLIRTLYLRLGYSLTDLEQSPETAVGGASGTGLTKAYGLKNGKYDGVVLGGGWVFAPLIKFNLYVQYEYFMISQIKATQHLMSAGLRWYF